MSEVKVNKISPRTACGTTTLGDSGDTFNIPSGSKINVASGGNITVASGATITNNGTQTGFGREGTVNWQTGSIKTTTFTAVNGEGYFANTSAGAFTMNLPAGSAGAIVSVSDYTRTFQTYNLTLSANGSEKIGGIAADTALSTEGQSITLVYVDAAEGWINVQDSTSAVQGRAVTPYITATGGCVSTSGDYKIHTFNCTGTFTVTNEGTCAGSTRLDYLVIAGGGGGGNGGAPPGYSPGGGGSGGYRESVPSPAAWTGSPLAATTGITAAYQAYPITIGAGGTYNPADGSYSTSGSNSIFSTITSAGGGKGGGNKSPGVGTAGGSGGGGRGGDGGTLNPGGAGNTPPVSPSQGSNGGDNNPSPGYGAGAGGGATAVGGTASGSSNGNGGAGATSCISGSPTARGGGGGGGSHTHAPSGGSGGPGGGGNGSPNTGSGTPGTINTGGGGGGSGAQSQAGGNGGSGVVVIRYKYQ